MKKLSVLLLPLAIAAAVAACSKPAEPAAAAPAAAPALETQAAAPVEAAVAEVKPVSGAYQLDPDHSGVLAQWTHFGFSKPLAHFRISEATLTYDAADVSKSSVEVTLPIASIDTFVPALDEHLQKADFFDVAKFPNATFKSTSVQAAGTNKLTVVGDLTIKDQTHPVTLDVTLNGAGKHAMTGQTAMGFSATGQIKRSDFGVGAFAPNVSDEVALQITGEGALAEAPAESASKE
ncbi:MAG: YceI family protein [Thermomonas sp.]|uniref:YceI family protein n=1 Tax=Thermomonas sp. TaxID=1971895 RepID=UPI001EB6AB4E|nr:YceI family protein [Thermomonas sp.]MBV2208731.1 YceI family protein [Thermomonas sp.]